jgi:hypothetical protein
VGNIKSVLPLASNTTLGFPLCDAHISRAIVFREPRSLKERVNELTTRGILWGEIPDFAAKPPDIYPCTTRVRNEFLGGTTISPSQIITFTLGGPRKDNSQVKLFLLEYPPSETTAKIISGR